jgi:hypothetical protein
MQDLAVDKLASKRIPVASTLNSLRHLVGEYAKPIRTDRDHPVVAAANSAAKPQGAIAPATTAAGIELERTYTGPMTISGTLSASNGQNGSWSGTLNATLNVTVDGAGNGTGYESFTGNITLSVGDRNSTEPLTFETPVFTLQQGKFDYPSGSFIYGNLIFSLDVKGSFHGSQQTIQEHLSLPFTGFVNGVSVSGSMNGDASVKTAPLTIAGTSLPLTASSAAAVKPFQHTIISDLSGTSVTATVTLSKAANGTLTNLAGGTYNKATGTYTVTGTGNTVNSAIEGLTFVSVGNLGSSGHAVATGLTLKVTDGEEAARSIQTSVSTTDPLSIHGILPHLSTTGTNPVKPFHNVTIGDSNGGEIDTIKIVLSNPGNGTLRNLSGGVYVKKSGIYVLHATAAQAMSALRTLEFDPAKSSASGVVTSFKITVENSAGAFVTNANTTVTATSATGVKTNSGAALFRQYIALGLHGAHDLAAALSAHHDLSAHPLSDLVASHR